MKKMTSILLTAALLLGLLSGCAAKTSAPAEDAADMILTNGTVYTADASDTMAEAIAVKGEKIIFVGSSADAEKYKGDKTQVIDLKGEMVLPGMTDSHLHPPGAILTKLYSIDLNGVQKADQTMQIISDYVKAHPEMDAYFGSGYNIGAFSGEEAAKGPKKERLDAICPDKPIILRSYDGHSMWVNSKALEQAGITKDTPDPVGGVIERNAAGDPWGSLKESAEDLVPAQEFTEDQLINAADEFQKYMHGLGYTEVIGTPGGADEFLALDKQEKLKMYASNAIIMDPQADVTKQVQDAIKERDTYNKEGKNCKITTLKFLGDGVIEGVTAYLTEPYEKAAGKENGLFLWDMDKLKDAFTQANANGFQIHVHSIGDGSTKNVLDALEYAKANAPAGDYRNCITHLQLVRPEDIQRFADLKVIAVTQSYWAFKEPNWWETVDSPFLGARAEKEYPVESFFKAGVTVTGSSDYPVTPVNNPFWAIEVGVTRNLENADLYGVDDITSMDDPKYLSWPEERASVKNMIKAFTINAAYQAFNDKITGSIEVGKNADMIVVDQNILAVDPIKIDSTKVLKTIFKGEVVYDADSIE